MPAKGQRSKSVRFLLVVMLGLFSFSEGKPCPEKTRAHKTRCDTYYKCVLLPSKSHVWIPEKCEQGLIYEPNLRICVLPGDDWECNLGDANKSGYSDDDNVVFGVGVEGLSAQTQATEDPEVVSDTTPENEDIMMEDYVMVTTGDNMTDFESSGDGGGTDFIMVDTVEPESKTSNEMVDISDSSSPTKIDPKLTAHLQRLSQLIDGLKQTYQSKETASSDLRPDQLNAFLAHYNIKSQLDSLNPIDMKPNTTTPVSTQTPIQNYTEPMATTTPSNTHLDPETKVVLTNQIPGIYSGKVRPTDGYSNSQIVVNKPEGSVLFTLGNQPQDQIIDHRYDPKISEETLKTVLELSKQMIENQNVRQVIPSSYYPHVVQPIYLPPPIPQYAQSVFNQHDGYDDKKYDKVSSTYYVPQDKNEKPPTTIIHNNVITTIPEKPDDPLDSYGQKLNSYPPLNEHQYGSSETSNESQNQKFPTRYENNQLVTIRPTQGYSSYHFQNDYRPTTTSRPFISDSGSTLTDYYTPSPHLDESNVNNVFQVERYPTLNYGNVPPRPSAQSSYNALSPNQNQNQVQNQSPNQIYNPNQNPNTNYNRPSPPLYFPAPHQQSLQDNPYQTYYNPYQAYYYPTHTPQSLNKLFPSLDASKVKIRPNSQKLESMEQETAEDESNSQSIEDDQDSSISDDNQQQTYNSYVDKQIVANQLAQYMEHLNSKRPQRYGSGASTVSPIRNRLPLVSQLSPINQLSPLSQLAQQSSPESLLNLSGNLFGYNDYKAPLPQQPTVDTENCPPGIRQPNTTDCTRYYMCSRTDSTVLQYSCPDYTAFNPQSKMCDAHFYSICHPGAVISRYTVEENRRVQMEALKALQNAQRIRDQALQAQKLALRLSLGKTGSGSSNPQQQYASSTMPPAEYPTDVLSNILQNAIETNGGSANAAPPAVSSRPHGTSYGSSMVTKKRKYYCKEGDKVADQTSIYNYFVCYKNAQGMMKGHKLTCLPGLLFCPMTLVCTVPERCQ